MCPSCGSVAPNEASFCPRCGASFHARPAPPAPSPAAPPPQNPYAKDKSPWLYVGGALLAVAAILGGLGAFGLLKFGSQDEPTLQAAGPKPPPVLQREAPATTPTLPVANQRKEMPADVRAWLEHLERIEKKKNALHIQQSTEIKTVASLGMVGQMKDIMKSLFGDESPIDTSSNPQSGTSFTEIATRVQGEWNALRTEFNTLPPPAECRELHASYDGALAQVGGIVGDMLRMLGSITPDNAANMQDIRTRLREIDARHAQYIDQPLKNADRMLGEICGRYDVAKWFVISPDLPAGSLGRMSGM